MDSLNVADSDRSGSSLGLAEADGPDPASFARWQKVQADLDRAPDGAAAAAAAGQSAPASTQPAKEPSQPAPPAAAAGRVSSTPPPAPETAHVSLPGVKPAEGATGAAKGPELMGAGKLLERALPVAARASVVVGATMSLKGDTADPHADLAGHDDLSLDLGEPGQVTVSRKDGGLFGLLPGTPLMTLKGNFQDTPNGVEGRVFDDQGQTAGSFQNGVLHLTPEAESRLDVLAGRAGGKAPGAGASKTVDGKPLAAEALPAAAAAAVSQAKSEGCDLAFVEEPSSYAKDTPWRKYEDQTPGRLFDPVTGNPIVPALRYDNKNPNGAPYVRFDGFQPMAGGEIEVIDSKLSITNFQHGGKMVVPENITDQFERQSRALKQNPGCVGMINMPNAAEQTKAEAVIKGLGIVNLPVSIRPFIQ